MGVRELGGAHELRLTYEDYNIYKTSIGQSMTNLTYDRGVVVLVSAF